MNSRTRPLVTVASALLLLLFAIVGCGSTSPVGSIQISASSSTLAVGATMQLHATDTNFLHITSDATATATWSSSNPAIVSVNSATGLVTGVTTGYATVRAQLDQDAGATVITVTGANGNGGGTVAGLKLSPANATVYLGGAQAYSAMATNSTGTTTNVTSSTTWSVAPTNVATITSAGLLTPVVAGNYTVTGVSGGQTAKATGAVAAVALSSIAVTPATSTLAGATTEQLTAIGTYNDGSSRDLTKAVAWTSSNRAVLTVDVNGLATASSSTASMTVNVSATVATGASSVTGTTIVQVTANSYITDLVVRPTSSSIATGSAEQHMATAWYSDGSQKDVTKDVIWTSTHSGISAVNANGMNVAATPGVTTLQATISKTGAQVARQTTSGSAQPNAVGNVQSSSVVIVTAATVTSLDISASKALFPVGSKQPIKLIGTFSDGSTQDLSLTANWQSLNPSIATIDSTGVATGVSAGKVVFTANFGGLIISTDGFEVLPTDLISTTVAVDYAGQITGLSEQLHVYGTYADGSTHDLTGLASFVSSDPTIFAVNETGLANGIATGVAQITATVAGFSAITNVDTYVETVSTMSVFPQQPRFALGTHLQLAASITADDPLTGVFSQDVTGSAIWTSSDPTVLTIDQNGLAKSGKAGMTTVSAKVLGVTKYSDTITVTNAQLQKIVLSKAPASIAVNTGAQYTVTGFFDDGSVQDLTLDAVWNTADNTIASVDNDGTTLGLKRGQTQVMASMAGKTAIATLTITDATLVSTSLLPGNIEVPINFYTQYTMTGTFSDGTTQNLNFGTIFQSPTPFIASFFPVGLGGTNYPGIGQLTGQYGYFSASTPITVSNANLTSVTLTPAKSIIRLGDSLQLTTTGIFDDGLHLDLGGEAYLTSSAPLTVTASRSGLVYGTSLGTSTLTANMYGQTSSATVTVLSNVLSSITLAPKSPAVTPDSPLQLTATGIYRDGSTDDLTNSVAWTSSDSSLLSVNVNGLAVAAPSITSATTVTVTATAAATSTHPAVISSFVVTIQPSGSGGTGGGTTPTALQVTPTSIHLAVGTTKQLTATAAYADGTAKDISSSVTWTTTNPITATVSATGLVTAVKTGTVSVQAQLGTLSSSSIIIVSSATLQSLAISPSGAMFAAGTTQQFTLTGTYSDGTTQNISSGTTWSTSNAAVASVSATGLATGVGPGTVQFSASYAGLTATSASNTVTPLTLVSIKLTPINLSFAKGTTQQFTVTGTYSDGSTRDITSSATFATSGPSVVSVSTTGLATGLGVGSAKITVSAGGQTASTQSLTVTPAVLSSVTVTPKDLSFADGTTQQFTAVGTFTDGTTQDLTHQVVWTSSDPQAITIDQNGVATGGSVGSAQITATMNGISASTNTIKVTPATLVSLILSPTTVQLAKGTAQQFTATGVFSDGTSQNLSSTVTWTSSNGAIVSIDGAGMAQGTGTGAATITASYQGKTASTTNLTVTPATLISLSFNPANPTVASGTNTHVTVLGIYSDGTTQDLTSTATFSSSNPTVASVSSGGVITGALPGTSTITVTAGRQTSSFNVAVSAAVLTSLTITPAIPPSFAKGTTLQFTATGTFSDGTTQNLSSSATWISSNPQVFTIDSNGLATGTGIGSASLTATYQGQVTATSTFQVTPAVVASLEVTPQNQSLAAGASQQFTAIATNTDGTVQNVTNSVTWTSSNTTALTVSPTGFATAGVVTTPANVVLTATGGTKTASATVAVQATGVNPPSSSPLSIIVTPTSAHLAAGTTVQLTVIGYYLDGTTKDITSTVTWSSTDATTANVSSGGLVTALLPGTVGVQAQVQGQFMLLTNSSIIVVSTATLQSLSISPSGPSFALGSSQQFTLTGTYTDGSTQNLTSSATWSSSNPVVATISSTGLATGASIGSVQFTGSYGGKTVTSIPSSITPATLVSISLSPNNPSFAKGTSQQFTVTGTYSDGSTGDLTSSASFASTNPDVVSVSSAGLASGVGIGSAQVTVSVGGQTAFTQSVTVTSATLVSINLTPQNISFAAGFTQQFTAVGTFTDGSTQDLTKQALWSSSNAQVLTIDQNGLATSVSTGSAQIKVSLNGVTASTNQVQVTPVTLTRLSFTPVTVQLAKGTTQQFTATGTFTDGSTQDLTSTVSWSSSNGTVASIDKIGFAVANGIGTAQISATYMGQTASTNSFTVTPATLVAVTFNPAQPTIASGTSTHVSVIGLYSDGSTQDLTRSATFTSSNPLVASIGTDGVIKGVLPGTSTITVMAGGQTSTFNVTVSLAILQSLVITPAGPASLAKGTTEQFNATGTFSDGSTQNLSSTVLWLSSDSSVLTIDGKGLAKGIGVGSVTITVTAQGQIATTSAIQVTPASVASIAVTPQNIFLSVGTTQQYSATATYTDGTTANVTGTATWSSSNNPVAVIDNNGFATAQGAGVSAFTAQLGGRTGSSTLTVTASQSVPTLQQIIVTTSSSSPSSMRRPNGRTSNDVQPGTTQQFFATGVYSDSSMADITATANWTSSAPSVATINAKGLASAVSAGTTTIQAELGGLSGSLSFTVTALVSTLQSIAITPAASSVAKGNTQHFTAAGLYSDGSTQDITNQVTWQSSVPAVANISNNGLATSLAGGNTQIWASLASQSAVATLTVSPATLSSISVTPQATTVASGTTQQFEAVGKLSDGSTQDLTNSVTWSSSNSALAMVNGTGLATTAGTGTATISATAGGVSNSITLTVSTAVVIGLQVTPATLSLPAGNSQQLLVTATFSDLSSQDVTAAATYATTSSAVVSVDSKGNLIAVGPGTATVTITLNGNTVTLKATVGNATATSIAIAPQNPTLAAGQAQQLTATVTYSDGSTQNLTSAITWVSSNSTVATVSPTGNVIVAQLGTATISATYSGISASVSVTGTSAVFSAISVSPAGTTLAAGQAQQFAATATLSDGTQQTVTSSVHWSVSDPTKATVSNTTGSNGTLTANAAGALSVLASLNGISGAASVTVTAATLSSLTINPSSIISLPAGTNEQLSVTAAYSDGSSADVTTLVTWNSSHPSTGFVDQNGLLHAVSSGLTTINAVLNGITGTSIITIGNATLNSITLTPSNPVLAAGQTVQMSASGSYSDLSSADITNQVQWSSSNPSVTTLSATGLATTFSTGSARLTASQNGVTQSSTLTVTTATLQSISVQSSASSFALGQSLQLKAIGLYSDGSTEDLTRSVTWSSNAPAVGVVSSTGVSTGSSAGVFTAKASSNGILGTLPLTVTNAVLVSIFVTPTNQIIVNLSTTKVPFTAVGTFSDGSSQNLSSSVHWGLTGLTIGTISSTGVFSPLGVGAGTVTATSGSMSGSASITVVSVPLL